MSDGENQVSNQGSDAGDESHPHADRLAAYHDGELSAAEEEPVRDHLVACRDCARLLLDLDGLADPGFGAGSGEAAREVVWRRLRTELAPAAVQAPIVPLRRSTRRPWRVVQTLAAALLVTTVGLSLWVASLRRTLHELSAPEVNAPLLDLDSGTARGEGTGRPAALTVPARARFFTLILNPAGQRRDRYRVVIERAGGGSVWSFDGVAPNSYGSLSLTLSRRALGAGDFRLRLLGPEGESIGEYAVRVEGP